MLFNSLNFIIFLVAVVIIYYLLPKNNWREVFFLGASYYVANYLRAYTSLRRWRKR